MNELSGRTVVLTRAREQHDELAELLSARGAVPVSFPTIVIRPVADPACLDAALNDLNRYDWLVFTSANAVSSVSSRLAVLGKMPPPTVRIAAVGPATAQSLAAHGIQVSAVPELHRGGALPAELGDLTGRRVLLPRSDIGREETVDALRAAGADVVTVIAYHTVPTVPDVLGLAALRGGVDAITFTAPSTVRNFMALLPGEAIRILRGTTVVCIGPTTAAGLTLPGLSSPLVAASATAAGMVEALAGHFGHAAHRIRPT